MLRCYAAARDRATLPQPSRSNIKLRVLRLMIESCCDRVVKDLEGRMPRRCHPASISMFGAAALLLVTSLFLSLLPLHSAAARPCSDFGVCTNGNSPAGEFPSCSCGVSCPMITQFESCQPSGDEWTGYQWSCECSWDASLGPDDPPRDEPWREPGFCGGIVCSDGSAPIPDGGNCLCGPGLTAEHRPGARPSRQPATSLAMRLAVIKGRILRREARLDLACLRTAFAARECCAAPGPQPGPVALD